MTDTARLESRGAQDCLDCGRPTGAGSGLFASRRRGKDKVTGDAGWLCHACQAGTAGLGGEQAIPLSGRYVVIDIQSMQSG